MNYNENKPPAIVIAGPTASGKTAAGIALAKILNGEIVSADSMQIYKGMDIATAKLQVGTKRFQGFVVSVVIRIFDLNLNTLSAHYFFSFPRSN